jgi:hypothetical protein
MLQFTVEKSQTKLSAITRNITNILES